MKPAADALRDRRRQRRAVGARTRPRRCAPASTRSSRSWTPTARRGACCTTTRCPAAARSPQRIGEYRARMEALVTAALQERTESRAVEPLSVAIFGAAEALGPLVAAHGRAVRRAHRRALDPHHRTRTEDEMRTTRRGRHHRRQPDPVRALERGLRARVRPGHAHRDARRARRALRRWRASGSARSSPAPCSSTRATATSRASPCWAPSSRPRRPRTTSSRRAAPGLETTIAVANKIALGQIDVGIAGGVDTASDAPIAVNEDLRHILLDLNRAKSLPSRARTLTRLRPGQVVPEIPRNAEPRTGLSMGEHAALMARDWGVTREEQDELTVASHQQHGRGLRARVLRRPGDAVPRAGARPEPARRTRRWRSWRSSSRCSAARTGR